ncbi:hypothetical protein RD792_005727 [Penstemon davidsonii]|uniref:Uncharacterized protein n=1 Tax=Penstemon davidsonii TaxID=160366 RepID=A0ABR0DEF0_9LAMI|nr:hypothetical protein RD792_005727 [Penstemon davidsonii]
MKMANLVNNSSFCVVFLLILALENLGTRAETKAFFVFGDSLVDNGNNNFLATLARADTPPYGEVLGWEPTLPYLSPQLKDKKLLVGANFASAGVGVLNDTGIQFRLHQLGVGRVLVTGTGPLGCVPAEMALHSRDGECAEELQQAASLYNPQLVQMLDALNKDIGHDVFIAANTNQMNMDFITNPEKYGFKVSKVACCGQGPYNGLGLCTPLSNLCENRDEYVFWDAFHPSERANRIIVDQLFNGSNTYMYPMNLNTIMALDSRA